MEFVNEASAPIGILNSIMSLNPFGKTKKIVDLMKQVNTIRINLAKEKGLYHKKLKSIIDKYNVGSKVSEDEQEALLKEYQDSLNASLSEYSKDLNIQGKDSKALVKQMFAEKTIEQVVPAGTHLEKVPDIEAFKQAYDEKIKAMEAKTIAMIAQAKELSSKGNPKNVARNESMFIILKNWIEINAANQAIKFAEGKEKDAIKANIKIKEGFIKKIEKQLSSKKIEIKVGDTVKYKSLEYDDNLKQEDQQDKIFTGEVKEIKDDIVVIYNDNAKKNFDKKKSDIISNLSEKTKEVKPIEDLKVGDTVSYKKEGYDDGKKSSDQLDKVASGDIKSIDGDIYIIHNSKVNKDIEKKKSEIISGEIESLLK